MSVSGPRKHSNPSLMTPWAQSLPPWGLYEFWMGMGSCYSLWYHPAIEWPVISLYPCSLELVCPSPDKLNQVTCTCLSPACFHDFVLTTSCWATVVTFIGPCGWFPTHIYGDCIWWSSHMHLSETATCSSVIVSLNILPGTLERYIINEQFWSQCRAWRLQSLEFFMLYFSVLYFHSYKCKIW